MFDPKDYKKLCLLVRPGDIIRTNLDGSSVTDKIKLMEVSRTTSNGEGFWASVEGKEFELHPFSDPKETIICELVCPKEMRYPTGTWMDTLMGSREAVSLLKELTQ